MPVSISLIGPLFGTFNQVINENDGAASVCVTFMDDSAVMVDGILTTANSTAIGIKYYIFITLHLLFSFYVSPTSSIILSLSLSSLSSSLNRS